MKNYFVNELDLTSFKFAAIKWFFKSLEESAKCCQKILCGHTDESKCLAYRHILKTVVKVVEEKFNFLCFSRFKFISLHAIHRADPPCHCMRSTYVIGRKTKLCLFVTIKHTAETIDHNLSRCYSLCDNIFQENLPLFQGDHRTIQRQNDVAPGRIRRVEWSVYLMLA